MKDPFANTTHYKMIHRPSSMRSYNNHINPEFRCLFQYRFSSFALYKQGRGIQTCRAESIRNLLYLTVLVVECFRQGIPYRLRTRFKSNEIRVRLCNVQKPYSC